MKAIILFRDLTYNVANSCITLIRILILARWFSRKPEKHDQSELIVLGNGPSLKSFLQEHRNKLAGRALLAVNYFARTDEYKILQPEFYVICSPEYFKNEEKEEFAREREITLRKIGTDTSWPMQLVVPNEARSSTGWKKHISNNQNITVRYMNNVPVEGLKLLNHWLFKWRLGMPRPHNVLIPAIWLGVNLKCERVYLAGADHSWLPQVMVDEMNNVLLVQNHFYDDQTKDQASVVNKPIPKPMFKGASKEKRKLHEVIHKFFLSFQAYWTLREYAEWRSVQIFNVTKGSFIDAFDRLDAKNLPLVDEKQTTQG